MSNCKNDPSYPISGAHWRFNRLITGLHHVNHLLLRHLLGLGSPLQGAGRTHRTCRWGRSGSGFRGIPWSPVTTAHPRSLVNPLLRHVVLFGSGFGVCPPGDSAHCCVRRIPQASKSQGNKHTVLTDTGRIKVLLLRCNINCFGGAFGEVRLPRQFLLRRRNRRCRNRRIKSSGFV